MHRKAIYFILNHNYLLMGCIPAGCHTYSKPYNRIRHCQPSLPLIIMRYLNFITAATKNPALQSSPKGAQPNAETRNYLKHGSDPCGVLLKTGNKLWCLSEFSVATTAPQHGLRTKGVGIQGSAKPGPNSSPGFSFNHISSMNTVMLSRRSLCSRKSENDHPLHLVCSQDALIMLCQGQVSWCKWPSWVSNIWGLEWIFSRLKDRDHLCCI